jgi:hypothetical protein
MTLPDWKRLQSTRFCAQCVAEYPVYHRYEWSLVPVTICSLHNIYLIENCENCSKSLKIKDIVYGRCLFCNHNLYTIEEIEGNLERKWTEEITELTNSIFWLMHLNIKEFYSLLKWLMYNLNKYFSSFFKVKTQEINLDALYRYG